MTLPLTQLPVPVATDAIESLQQCKLDISIKKLSDAIDSNLRKISMQQKTIEMLTDLLTLALPSVEDCDKFNKPTRKIGPTFRKTLAALEEK